MFYLFSSYDKYLAIEKDITAANNWNVIYGKYSQDLTNYHKGLYINVKVYNT